jgi:hypothetical protein
MKKIIVVLTLMFVFSITYSVMAEPCHDSNSPKAVCPKDKSACPKNKAECPKKDAKSACGKSTKCCDQNKKKCGDPNKPAEKKA